MADLENVRVYGAFNTFYCERTYIVTEYVASTDYSWSGHILILSKSISVPQPLIEYSLSSERVGIKISDFMTTKESFEQELLTRGVNQYDYQFYTQKREDYFTADRIGKVLRFDEFQNARHGISIIANDPQNGSGYKSQLLRLSRHAFSKSLQSEIINACNIVISATPIDS